MQVRLNVSIAYYVDGSLRTAGIGQVVTDLPVSDAMRLIQDGSATEETPPEAPSTEAEPQPKRRTRRGE